MELQRDAGLQDATDGEFRRATWHMDFINQIGGIGQAAGHIKVRFRNASGDIEWTPAAIHVDRKLKLDHTIFGDHFEYLKSLTKDLIPKLTIPSPNMVHYRGGPAAIDEKVYPDPEEFWHDLAAAYADEITRLHALGCTYLQLDDTSPGLPERPGPARRADRTRRRRRAPAPALHQAGQRRDQGQAGGMTITTHLCRGNFQSSWAASGGYDFVAEALFGNLDVDGFFLEYDDERSGGFEPLRFVPKGKMVVLGLVTTKSGALEDAGRAEAPHRARPAVRASRPAVPVPAVRLLLDRGGQHAHPGRAGRQARARRQGRRRCLGVTEPGDNRHPASRRRAAATRSSVYPAGLSASDKIPSISGRGTRQSAQAPSPATTRTITVPGELSDQRRS